MYESLRPHGPQHTRLPITNSQSLLKLMSIQLVMPSNHLILCHSLLLPSIFPSIRVFSNESILHIRRPRYWSFSFSISPSNEYSGLVPNWERCMMEYYLCIKRNATTWTHLKNIMPCGINQTQRINTAWSYLYEVPVIEKITETGSRIEVTWGGGQRGVGNCYPMGQSLCLGWWKKFQNK